MKFSFSLRYGIKLFKETLSLNLASVVTVVTVLFIYSMFVIIGNSADLFLKEITKTDTMRIYLKTNSSKKADDIINKLKGTKGVASLTYYSPEEAYNYLKESTQNINYLDKIPMSLFPSFIELTIEKDYQNLTSLREIEREIIQIDNVDTASYGEKWIQNFNSIRSAVKIFIIVLTLMLTVSVGIIIFNTIRLSLFRYKDDIRIYNLVGATRSFIETPYIICAFFEITIAYVFSSAIVYLFLFFINVKMLAPVGLSFIAMPELSYFLKTYVFLIAVGCIASLISVASFLNKVKSINES